MATEYISYDSAIERLGCSRTSFFKLLDRNVLSRHWHDRRVMVRKHDVESLAAELEGRPTYGKFSGR